MHFVIAHVRVIADDLSELMGRQVTEDTAALPAVSVVDDSSNRALLSIEITLIRCKLYIWPVMWPPMGNGLNRTLGHNLLSLLAWRRHYYLSMHPCDDHTVARAALPEAAY
jgi:hypothetical protein